MRISSAEIFASNEEVRNYGRFASPKAGQLNDDVFCHILSFMGPDGLRCAQAVCRSWREFIRETDQWKRRCQKLLELSVNEDPMLYLPKCGSYQEGFQLVLARVLCVESELELPSTPKGSSLRKWNEPDPLDPTAKIGEKYIWIYVPPYLKVTAEVGLFYLDKADDPNDEESPRFVEREVGIIETLLRGLRLLPINKVMKVPLSIHNLNAIFCHNKSRINELHLMAYNNKRIPSGWVCMREKVIGKGLPFAQQQAAATAAGVEIAFLGHRIFFNYLMYLNTNTYPDGRNPRTYARTSERVPGWPPLLQFYPLACGEGDQNGLAIHGGRFNDEVTGAAVVLPM